MTHTPGPWKSLRGIDPPPASRHKWNVYAPEMEYVATCDSVLAGDGDDERNNANARLIAAAPDLLAALERLAPEPEPTRFESGRRCRFCGSNRRTHNDDCAWVQAREAVAKAKGD